MDDRALGPTQIQGQQGKRMQNGPGVSSLHQDQNWGWGGGGEGWSIAGLECMT